MTKEQKQGYQMRIMEANRGELVVIIYELFLHALDDARVAFKSGESEEGIRQVKKAEAFLQELMGSLDRRYEIAEDLMRLYRYVYEQLIFSVLRKKIVNDESICFVMGKLKEAFSEAAKKDNSEPLMEHTQKIYAGLTYGKNSLNEVLLSGDEIKSSMRGFQA